jgi:predicted AlkP superfamily phosphohydrolase/phosphomutase
MPVTFPPPNVNGVVVSGFGSPSDVERAAFPPGFLNAYPDYRIDMDDTVENVLGTPRARSASMNDADISHYAEQLAAMAEARHRVFADLLNEDFALASVVYVGADRLSHVAWPHVAAVLDGRDGRGAQRAVETYYSTLDRILGETRRLAGDALFLVTSDHGQGAPPEREIAINAWLKESGWLATRASGVRKVARLGPSAARRWMWSAWRRISNAPTGSAPLVDWDRTVAYGIPMSHCRVVGVAVRDGGTVRQEIAEGLLELTDPYSGRHPVERVVFADDICRNRGRATYPDLLAILSADYGATGKVDGDVVRDAPPGASGFHEPEGILLAAGPGVVRGEHAEASIADIAPTILRAHGLEPLQDMDGSVLPWVVGGAGPLRTVERSAEPENVEELSARDEELIESHLRDLGYVD